MPDFVRQRVSLREVAARTEALIELPEEAEVDVRAAIERAIEGPSPPSP